jgi:predicted nuclease with TOPRIM domain
MRQRLEERLATLKGEYEKGQNRSRQLEGELTSVRETMLRISGGILVLQELLAPMAKATPDIANGNAGNTVQVEPSPSVGDDSVSCTK